MNANQQKHLDHPFYAESEQFREIQRIEQILKGADKYPNPFDPADWTAEELTAHAVQENIDQMHYIFGLYKKLLEQNVTVKKNKGGVDTVIEYKGNTYQLQHKDQLKRGGKK